MMMEENEFKLNLPNLLEGLEDEKLVLVENLYNQINFHDIKHNRVLLQLTPAILRHLVHYITDTGQYGCSVIHDNWRGLTPEKVLALIDVEEVIASLDFYCSEFIPLAEKYLNHLDAQAEMAVKFSENYIFSLIDKIPKEKKKEIWE